MKRILLALLLSLGLTSSVFAQSENSTSPPLDWQVKGALAAFNDSIMEVRMLALKG